MFSQFQKISILGFLLVTVSGCAINQPSPGNDDAVDTANKQDDNNTREITRCIKPVATVALEEGSNPSLDLLGVSSPIPALRLIMSRSNCFKIVNRGQALNGLILEQNLNEQYTLKQEIAGQFVTPDYLITPQILSSNSNASGLKFSLANIGGGLFGSSLGSKKSTASVMLTMTNVRTGVQELVVEGSASKSDLSAALTHSALWNQSILSSYQNTEMGRLVITAFLNAHNKLVDNIKKI